MLSQRIKIIISLFLFAVLLEGLSYPVGRYLQSKGVFYDPQEGKDYKGYILKRDPILGWPSPATFGDGVRDKTGSRIIPAFPDEGDACVSLYGDSFTWSSEVDHEHAWSNLLSILMNCRVANYGVEGYGTDQSYLRFKHNIHDKAKIIILGHLSENIQRNVNQFRGLMYPEDNYGLKPRFLINASGNLELIPMPTPSEAQFIDIVNNPERHLHDDYFVPGGPLGTQKLSFPYTWSILKALQHFHVQAAFLGKPWYSEFYSPEHPSNALAVTVGIIEEFNKEAVARGRQPVVLIIPTGLDLKYYQRKGFWVYQTLVDELNKIGIKPVNIGPDMLAHLGNRDPCVLFRRCSSHYNAEGYQVLANLVYDHLKGLGIGRKEP